MHLKPSRLSKSTKLLDQNVLMNQKEYTHTHYAEGPIAYTLYDII